VLIRGRHYAVAIRHKVTFYAPQLRQATVIQRRTHPSFPRRLPRTISNSQFGCQPSLWVMRCAQPGPLTVVPPVPAAHGRRIAGGSVVTVLSVRYSATLLCLFKDSIYGKS